MGLLRNVLASKEYVVQERDGRTWVDVGLADINADPDEFELSSDIKTRMICRKGDKVKEVVWMVDPAHNAVRKPEPKSRQRKQKSPIDAIQDKAAGIRRDREKLMDVKDVIDDMLGTSSASEPEEFQEWQYPGMMKGMNMGLGHAMMTGMQKKDEDIAQAGLEMVRGLSGIVNVIPMLATAYAKGRGINVGLFGMEDSIGSSTPPPQQPPAQPQSDMIHEHDDGFEVDTIQEDEYEDVDYTDEDRDGYSDADTYTDHEGDVDHGNEDPYADSEVEGESDIDIHGLGEYSGDEDNESDETDKGYIATIDEVETGADDTTSDMDNNGVDSDDIDGSNGSNTAIAEPDEIDLAPFGINNKSDSDESDDAYMTDAEVLDIAEPEDPRPGAVRFRGLANEDQP